MNPDSDDDKSTGKLFISYSRQDEHVAQQFVDEFKSQGVECWLDKTKIQPGEEWPKEIVDGIKRCEVMLLILSAQSAGSKNVEKEVGIAKEKKKRIIPIRIGECELNDGLLYNLYSVHRIDCIPPSPERIKSVVSQLLPSVQGVGAEPITEERSLPRELEDSQKLKPSQPFLRKNRIATLVSVVAIGLVVIFLGLRELAKNRTIEDVKGEGDDPSGVKADHVDTSATDDLIKMITRQIILVYEEGAKGDPMNWENIDRSLEMYALSDRIDAFKELAIQCGLSGQFHIGLQATERWINGHNEMHGTAVEYWTYPQVVSIVEAYRIRILLKRDAGQNSAKEGEKLMVIAASLGRRVDSNLFKFSKH